MHESYVKTTGCYATNGAFAGQHGAFVGQQSVPVPERPPRSITENISETLQGAIDRVHGSIERVRDFADHMLGPVPVGGANKDGPTRMGRTGEIQDRLDHLHAALDTLEGELSRLGPI